MNCPICSSVDERNLLTINCGNADQSVLYDTARIMVCSRCGHVYNKLTDDEVNNLETYYNEEYSPGNMSLGHKPQQERYLSLFNFSSDYLEPKHEILDIGCATGDFLSVLLDRGFNNLHGIDFSEPYISEAKANQDIEFTSCCAEDLPYPNDHFDFLFADQVVEHLVDPNDMFREASRVLKRGGYLCVSIPDAAKYRDYFFFDFYWFLIKEHIHHFDFDHLNALANQHGFSLINIGGFVSSMINDKAFMPGLMALFKNNNAFNFSGLFRNFDLEYKTIRYVEYCNKMLLTRKQQIAQLDRKKPLFIFGMSREFLYIYNNTDLPKCNIIGLVDDTPFKQDFLTYDGRKVYGREVLRNLEADVLITATAHVRKIKDILYELNLKGNIIEL